MFWSTLLFGGLNHTVSMILVDSFDIYSYTLDRSMFWSTLLIGVTLCQRSWLTLFSYTHIHWIGQCFGRLFCSEVSRLGTISGSQRRLNGKEWVRYFIIFYDILWYVSNFTIWPLFLMILSRSGWAWREGLSQGARPWWTLPWGDFMNFVMNK